jgi:uncharacterized membrane protein HdeD (DUF308 family)
VAATQDDSAQRKNAAQSAAYWPVPIARAVALAALAMVIAFTAEHSPRFGLTSFGIFAIVNAIVIGILAWRRLDQRSMRGPFIAQAVVSAVLGITSLAFSSSSIGFLFLVTTAFAAITGLLELFSGVRSRRRFVASTDWLIVGGLTVATAIVFLLVPPEYSQSFKDPDGVTRVLDSSVVIIGVLGAYAAIAAVYLVIAGLSSKWGTQLPAAAGAGELSIDEPVTAESERKA